MLRKTLVMLVLAIAATAALAQTTITVWRHQTGDEEMNANFAAIERFNAAQNQWRVVMETIPQGAYTESITAAALAGDLPCALSIDQPLVPNFAWAGHIRPLNEFATDALLAEFTPGGLGTFKDNVYSLGQFDVALAIFGRRSVLEANGIRIATTAQPWTRAEFDQILDTLAALPEFTHAIDVNAGWGGEWSAYGYSPMLQSFGGDLINRETFLGAEGVLNGPEAIAWGEWFQSIFANGWADPNPPDDQAFVQGRVPLHYTGSWSIDNYTNVWGEDLVILPPPDFGHGPKIGAASWQWAITSTCPYPQGAWAYIAFLMQPEEIAAMSEATGLIPTTARAAALTDKYAEGAPWRIFFEFSAQYAVPRPPTPAYPFISSTFEIAVRAIKDGVNVRDALDDAVDAIERNIADNQGFGFSE